MTAPARPEQRVELRREPDLPPVSTTDPVFRTDLDLAGQICEQNVAVTSTALTIADASAADGAAAVHFLRTDLRGCRTEPALGSTFLQVRVGERWCDVARCTNRQRSALAALAVRLDHWTRTGELPPPDADADDGASVPAVGAWIPLSRFRMRKANRRTLARIWELVRPHRGTALLLAILSLTGVGMGLVTPLLMKFLIDNVLEPKTPVADPSTLPLLLAAVVAGLLLLRLLGAGLGVWRGRVAGRVGAALTADLRTKCVRKLLDLPAAYHNQHQVGELMSRVAYDTEVMHTLVHQSSTGFLVQGLQLAGITGLLFWLNPRLAFIAMLPMPLVVAAGWYFSRFIQPRHQLYWESVGKQAAALTGMLSGVRVVKAFTQESREFDRFSTASDRLRDSRQTVDVSSAAFGALMALLFGLSELLVWFIGGRELLAGDQTVTLGTLTAFLGYLIMFTAPLATLTESTTWVSNFWTASRRIFELLDTPNDIGDPADAQRPAEFRGGVRFEDVGFAYNEGVPVLQEINFDVQPGQMVGVVGRSGSGKSTLVSLISRMYDPTAGRVLIDGVDVRAMNRQELRQRVGIVLQEPFLFRGSVATNIVYGAPDADPERTLRAARAAFAHDFIMRNPFAYDSQVGEGGSGLSGGERQRISIARALLYDPQILILDEATSSVDAESERAIQEALKVYAKGRTVIAIAHRLSTLRDADRLMVFDRGRMVEQGTPEELLARGGLYCSLVKLQTSLRAGVRELQAAGGGAEPDLAPEGFAGDGALFEAEGDDATDDAATEAAGDAIPDCGLRWLEPATAAISWDDGDALCLDDGETVQSELHAACAFPASHPHEFISLRRRDPLGGDVEVGIIRRLDLWPESARRAVTRSLGRRYLLRRITAVLSLRSVQGQIECVVETDNGPATFRINPHGDGLQHYGTNGRLLVDGDQNYYVIPNLDTLPRRQRRLLAFYFGG